MSLPRMTGAVGGALAILLGLMVLGGWAVHSTFLIQIAPDLPPMPRDSAIGFALSGLALLGIVIGRPRFTFIGSGITAILAAASLIEYLSGADTWRMPPATALCFIALSTGFLLAQMVALPQRSLALGVAGFLVAALGAVCGIGVIWGSGDAFTLGDFTRIAVPTSAGILMLGIGAVGVALELSQTGLREPAWAPIGAMVFVATVRVALLQVFSPRNQSGVSSTLSLLGAILGAVVLGGLVHLALKAHLQRELLRGVNRRLEEEMLERRRAEEAVHRANEQLEIRVEERTRALEEANQESRNEIARRERVEEDLRQQKEILQTIFDHVPVILKFVDKDGHVQMVNREWERVLGWSLDERVNRSVDIYQEGYPDPVSRQRILDFIANSTSAWADFRTQVKDGRFIDTSWAVVRLSDGASICIGQDISARKQAEQELRQQKEILQSIFDHLPVMINFVDRNEQLQLVNREWERTLGWSLEEVRSQNIDIIVENYPDPEYRQKVRDFVAGPNAEWMDFKTTVRDGRVIDTSWAILHLSDGTGIGLGQDISKRKRAEEALKESEERFRQLAENIHDLFWIKTPDFKRVLYLSPAYESITGRSPERRYQDDDYQPFLNMIHPEDREGMAQIMRNGLCAAFDVEFRIVRPDGSTRWIRDRGFPIRDQSGEIYRVAGIADDITERKRAEAALRESEERFRQLTENIREVFWLRSPDFKQLLYVSPMYEKVCGRTCESLYAAGPDMVGVHPEDRLRVVETVENVTGREFEIEYRIITKDGDVRWIRDRGFPIRDQSGEIYRIAGIADDVTERKLAEEALRESEERFRQLAENINEVFWITTADFRQQVYISPGFQDLTGAPPETLFPGKGYKSYFSFVHPEDVPMLSELTKDSDQKFDVEYRMLRADGSIRWVRDRGFPIRNRCGEIYRFGGVAEDITDRKEAEDRLKAGSEQLRSLSANLQSAREQEAARIARQIHDELGGFLTGLRWELEALDKTMQQPADPVQLKAMRDKLTNMLGLTDTTIDVVRRIAYQLHPTILDDLGLVEAVEWQTEQFQARTGIECHCDCSLPGIRFGNQQSTAVFRIVQEALTNILRHAQATRVSVAMKGENGVLVVEVSDNGRGITPAEISNKKSLGLHGMRERAHLIGGHLEIVSVRGGGTSLHARLPLAGEAT